MKRQASQARTGRRRRTPQEQAGILREHRRSGLSLLAFAREHGLCYASLLRWRSRQGKGTSRRVAPDPQADPGFVPVKVEGGGWSGDYVLSWSGGRSLRIPRQFETDALRRLLSVLEAVR